MFNGKRIDQLEQRVAKLESEAQYLRYREGGDWKYVYNREAIFLLATHFSLRIKPPHTSVAAIEVIDKKQETTHE